MLCANNYRREAYRLHADIVMSLEDIFGYSSKTEWIWTKLWQREGEWGKSDPIKFLARSLQKPQKKKKKQKIFTQTEVVAWEFIPCEAL